MDLFTDRRTKITAGVIGLVQVLSIVGVLPAALAEPVTALLGAFVAYFLRDAITNEAKKVEAKVEKVEAKVERVDTKVETVAEKVVPAPIPRR